VDYLVEQGLLSHAHRERLQILKSESGLTGAAAVRLLGVVGDTELADALAAFSTTPTVDDAEFEFVEIEGRGVSLKFLKLSFVCPIAEDDAEIRLAVADPTDGFAPHALAVAFGKPISMRVGTPSQIEKMIERFYESSSSAMSDIVEAIDEENELDDNVERLIDLASETPVVRLVNVIISRAVEMRASDIHIEPFEHQLHVRYRIDGVLKEVDAPPARSTAAVISRLKIMARLDIAERRLPQDGRIRIRAQGKAIDLRISTVPTMHGESVVLRVLDKEALPLDFEKIGFSGAPAQQFIDALDHPHGILLVTGPTGSGKTTTLYAALNRLNRPERKILTVEDPVEYQLDGINQIQIKPQIDLTFANALRSIVRQDPDIIMIGEMRDLETASIAVQSALTGHLVLSTLHTNDAVSSITRLLDMGVEEYLLTSTVNGILAQRLVRTMCNACKQPHPASKTVIADSNSKVLLEHPNATLFRPVGCGSCAQTGYLGRTVIYEYLPIDDLMRTLVLEHADSTKLQAAAVDAGMVTMREDGFAKVARGVTALEEVLRVTQSS
ncbi:MAG: type II secretion system protein GspE, partial [Proteobacteria bacterium]